MKLGFTRPLSSLARMESRESTSSSVVFSSPAAMDVYYRSRWDHVRDIRNAVNETIDDRVNGTYFPFTLLSMI